MRGDKLRQLPTAEQSRTSVSAAVAPADVRCLPALRQPTHTPNKHMWFWRQAVAVRRRQQQTTAGDEYALALTQDRWRVRHMFDHVQRGDGAQGTISQRQGCGGS